MLQYMLDTDTVSFALRGFGGVSTRLLEHKPSEICMSVITLAELRYGADRRSSRKLHSIIDSFAASVTVVSFDEAVAAQFGSVAATLVHQGKPIGDFDALIAAHALALDLTLVTNNTKHFSRVDGLRVDNWV
ncbi:PIN domain-containing protein [Sorangium sp. So ce131]|uniref:PIN domain-containing protein n=1 Tax=Sorangium sp. So ce131 TaxID=3133282 RepID=UPI003F630BEC